MRAASRDYVMSIPTLLLRLVMVNFALLACAAAVFRSHQEPSSRDDLEKFAERGLVSVEWVARRIHRDSDSVPASAESNDPPRPIIVEASWGPLDKAYDYHRGHVPGAIHVDTDLFETGYPTWKLRELDALQQQIGELGISPESQVIIYSEQLIAAARVWWILKYAGVRDVRIMNGDMRVWRARRFPMERSTRVLPEVPFIATARQEWLATDSDVLQAVRSGNSQLWDVRSSAEFAGIRSGYDYLKAKGRIPGAMELGDADDGSGIYRMSNGMLRSPDEVRELWQQRGLQIVPVGDGQRFEHEVIFYCGGGWRSSLTCFYSHLLGLENVRNYSDGWAGWSTSYQLRPSSSDDPPKWLQVPTGRPVE
jgi:thiosulfate/3-mercaptopyruvate sulfurtransferase